MLKTTLNTLVKYKLFVIIGGFLVAIVVGVFIFSKVVYSSKTNIVIAVKPSISLGPCFNNQTPPKTTIVAPAGGTKYTVGDKVALSGLAVLECNNSKIEDKNLNWYLNSETAPFASGLTYSLEGLKAGDHKIRLVATSEKLTSEAVVSIRFDDPKPQVLGIKTPPPAPPAAPPTNKPPVVYIAPLKEGNTITINEYSEQETVSRDIVLEGRATDPEDGELNDSRLEWLDSANNPLGSGSVLKYKLTTTICSTVTYNINLKAKDSKELPSTAITTITITHFNDQQCGREAEKPTSLLNLNLDLTLGL